MSAIKNLFRNGGGESFDRQLDHGYGVMIVTCLIEADSPSKAAVQQASKLGFRMRKTLSDKSLTASCVAREIVEGNINYIRYICDSLSGGTSCNVTLSYGYGATTNVMVQYDEASETDDCFVGRLLLLVELPENEMTSVVPPQDSLYEQIQACSSFPPEVYISPSTKIWDASFLFTNVQQNDSQGKTIHVKINTEGNIYSVESVQGNAQLANHLSTHATDIPPAPKDTNEKETVAAPAENKGAESTTDSVASKRKASEKVNAKESSKKPRVVTATKEPRTAAKPVDISTPKKSKKTGATSKSTPAAAGKKGKDEASAKSPRKQRGSKPAEPSPVQEMECGQDSSEEDVAVEKPTKSKTTSKSKKSKKNDTKGKDVQNQKQGDNKGETEEDTEEKESAKKASKTKSSKKKDPNAPKRPLSAYMLFCQDHREDIVKRNPGKSFGEIGMMLGAKYKALAQKDKAPYLAEAEKLRNQHKIDKKEYDDTHVAEDEVSEESTGQKEVQSPQSNKKKKKKKSKKDPNAPKGVMTAYMLFCSAKREQILKSNPGMSVPDTGKVLGKMWRDITAKEKEKFIKLAAKDKERYEDEMKAYKGVESV